MSGCQAMQLNRTVYRYQSVAADSSALQMRIKEIIQYRVHYGFRRVQVLLMREGFKNNHKRIYQLYQQQDPSLRDKRPRRNTAPQWRHPQTLAQRVNQMWRMDFMADNLLDGRRLRMLTVLDSFARESRQSNPIAGKSNF